MINAYEGGFAAMDNRLLAMLKRIDFPCEVPSTAA